MPLDQPVGQPPSQNDQELDDLRRRAGIATTPRYQELNPKPLMVPLSYEDMYAIIAALEAVEHIQEIVPLHLILQRFKRLSGQIKQPPGAKHNPDSESNPYYAARQTQR